MLHMIQKALWILLLVRWKNTLDGKITHFNIVLFNIHQTSLTT